MAYHLYLSAAYSDKLEALEQTQTTRSRTESCAPSQPKSNSITLPHIEPPSLGPQPERLMAVKTHTWISLWFLLSAPVIIWDVGYCFFRPRSMLGGDLHWIWKPYEIYQDIDYVYGLPSFESGSGFTNAQSFLNIIETILNLLYVWRAHVSQAPSAPVIGFAAAVMTLSKTALYGLQEYFCNYCAVGHNTFRDIIVYWIIPNGTWIVVPSLIVARLGKDITASLRVAQGVQVIKAKKTQ